MATATLLLLAACAPDVPAQDAAAVRAARKPPSELAAQKAVASYLAVWLKDPAAATYTFRPLASGSVTLGFGMKETGWFMCGTVQQADAQGSEKGPRMFFAHFDPVQPDIIDGAVDFTTGYGIVSHWCSDVYRSHL